MKTSIIYSVLCMLIVGTTTSCDPKPTPEQKTCLTQCTTERATIQSAYDDCVDEAEDAYRALLTACLGDDEIQACQERAFNIYQAAEGRCRQTRNDAVKNAAGCDAKCFGIDPLPVQ